MDPESPPEHQKKGRDLTSGSISRSLLAMAGPMLIGMTALVSVNVVDAFFIGQLGTLQLAAIGFCFPVMFFATGFANGFGSGVQSVVSRAVGAKDEEQARRAVHHGILLALLTTAVLVVAGLVWMEPIFSVLGASPQVFPHIRSYMTIWFIGLFFFVTPMVAGSALFAKGDATSPTVFLIGGAIVNGILDPILIFGLGPCPEMGMRGAALATLFSRVLVTCGTFFVLFRDSTFRPRLRGFFDGMLSSWGAVLRVGLPVALTGFTLPLMLGAVTRLLSEFGDPVVAGFGAGSRIDALSLLVSTAVGMGLAPIVGQNWGAGLRHRVRDAVELAQRICIGWGVAAWVVLLATAGLISPAFVEGEQSATTLHDYLMIVTMGYAGAGIITIGQQTLNAIDRASHTTIITVIHAGSVIVAAVVASTFGVRGVFFSLAAVDTALAVGVAVHVRRIISVPLRPHE